MHEAAHGRDAREVVTRSESKSISRETTFEDDLAGVTLTPGTGGIFLVRAAGVDVWSRKDEGRHPELAELKQRVRDVVAPGKPLGHSDRKPPPPGGSGA